MKKTLTIIVCLMATLAAFNAQAKIDKSELLGVWTQTINERGTNVISTYDFKEDNTVTQIFILNGTTPKMNIMADGTCKYEIKDDSIVFKFSASDFNFTAFEVEGVPAEYVGVIKQQMMAEMVNVEQKLSDVKIEGNTMTATAQGVTVVFTRN